MVASLVSCDCSVALPHGGMGWSAVCDFLIILTCFFGSENRLDIVWDRYESSNTIREERESEGGYSQIQDFLRVFSSDR